MTEKQVMCPDCGIPMDAKQSSLECDYCLSKKAE